MATKYSNYRDTIIQHLTIYGPCTTKSIYKLFPDVSTQYIRKILAKMHLDGYIQRTEVDFDKSVINYLKDHKSKTQKRDLRHATAISDFYHYLKDNGYNVTAFKRGVEVGTGVGVVPDAIVVARKEKETRIFYLEVELSHNSMTKKLENYKRLYNTVRTSGELVMVTNKPVRQTEIKRIHWLPLDYLEKPFKLPYLD